MACYEYQLYIGTSPLRLYFGHISFVVTPKISIISLISYPWMSNTYDFIIVGGGTAGCLLANRLLSSKKSPSVLIIEAGDHGDVDHRIPFSRYFNSFARVDLDHGYVTAPVSAVDDKVIPYARGKGLGGSSMINFMVYTRGAADDYEEWAKLVGSDEWSWEAVQARFKKIESCTDPIQDGYTTYAELGPGYCQGTGNLGISVRFEEEMGALLDAAEELGWKKNLDLNSGNPIGVGATAATLQGGMRTTSASAHIQTDAPNLTILVQSRATKLLFEGTKVIGVQVNGDTSVYASKEVILCAGSFDTPKLLLLSGVGPAEELKPLNISVIKDIPGIGKNMQDHCAVFVTDVVDAAMSSRVPFVHSEDALDEARKQWDKDRTGPLSVHYTSACAAFLKQEHLFTTPEFKSLSGEKRAYLQRPTVPSIEICFNGPVFPPTYPFGENNTCFTMVPVLMHPESRGSVTLKSSNPSDPPLIDVNFLSHPYDRLVMIDAIRESRKLLKQTSLSKYWVKGILAPEDDSDEAIWEHIKQLLTTGWHACSTVSMGKADDPMTCVDLDLKLCGLESIRVADMSVAPVLISGHTQSVAYLIAQTAAGKIIQEHGLNN